MHPLDAALIIVLRIRWGSEAASTFPTTVSEGNYWGWWELWTRSCHRLVVRKRSAQSPVYSFGSCRRLFCARRNEPSAHLALQHITAFSRGSACRKQHSAVGPAQKASAVIRARAQLRHSRSSQGRMPGRMVSSRKMPLCLHHNLGRQELWAAHSLKGTDPLFADSSHTRFRSKTDCFWMIHSRCKCIWKQNVKVSEVQEMSVVQIASP